jgi:hypothetical protein
VLEARQPHLRGGAREPLDRPEIVAKFRANAAFGGWSRRQSERLEAFCGDLLVRGDLAGLAEFRS